MKKIISAIEDTNEYEEFLQMLDGYAMYPKYRIEYDPSNEMHFQFIPEEDEDLMPIVEVDVNEEEGSYYFKPSMVFPKRIDGDDVDYYDSFEYLMDKYQKVGKLCTQIFKAVYTPGMYSDD